MIHNNSTLSCYCCCDTLLCFHSTAPTGILSLSISSLVHIQYYDCVYRCDSIFSWPDGLLSTKAWIKRGAETLLSKSSDTSTAIVKTDGTPTQTALTVNDTTDSVVTLQSVNLADVLASSYLGIVFGEGGWPYPEVSYFDC